MSAEAMRWARTQMPRSADGKKRDPLAKAILMCLCDRHSPTHDLFPSQETISRDTGLSRSTISKKLAQLEAQGYLLRERRYNRTGGPSRGQRTSDSYSLNLDRGPDDLSTREPQPEHLRRQTPVGSESTNLDKHAPIGFEDLPDFLKSYPHERHRKGSSQWSMDDLLDEVEDRFRWAFKRSPVSREGLAAHLSGMRKRLGHAQALERVAVTTVFEDGDSRSRMAGDLRHAHKVVLVAIADALIEARDNPDYPDIVRAEGRVDSKYACLVAIDGMQFPRSDAGRRDCDAHDRLLERQRLALP